MWEVLLVLGLVLVNAAFAGTEMAIVSLREGQLARLAESGEGGRKLVELVQDPTNYLSTIQLCITLAGFLASAAAAVSLAQPLYGPLDFLGGAAEPVAIVLVTMVLTYVTLVLGELAPKRIAMQRAEGWAMRAARPLSAVSTVARPLVWLLARSTDLVVRLFGLDPRRSREEVTEEEIKDLIAAQQSITPQQRSIIEGAFELDERRLRSVLQPRSEVIAVRADDPVEDARDLLVSTGHSRAPVHSGSLDDVVGVVHLRDLVGASGVVAEHLREPLVLPETLGVLDALRRLQNERAQLAVVLDEHGGTAGIVTVEDLLEEIVGEIYDEFDRDLDVASLWVNGSIELPGSFPAHDLADIGIDVETGDHATVAGVLLGELGRIPGPGDTVEVDDWHAEVLAMDGRAIDRVRLTRRAPEEPDVP